MPQPKTLSENGVAAFLFAPRWEWVSYPALDLVGDDLGDNPDFHGFRVEVLTNLNGFKAREHDVALREFVAATRQAAEVDDGGAAIDAAEDRYLQAIAWRVRAWNFRAENVAGEIVDVPAPGEGAIDEDAYQAFFLLPTELRSWTVRVIRNAARPKAMTRPLPNAGSTGTRIPPPTLPVPTPPAS